jgi:hypothetical protein
VQNSRIDLKASLRNPEVVEASTKLRATDLGDLKPASLGAVFQRNVLEYYHSMRETVKLKIVAR